MTAVLERRLLTVDEFYKMAEAGILTENDRVELINGELVKMAPIGSKHAAMVVQLDRIFSRHENERYIISAQNPLCINQYTELHPDLMILKPKDDLYSSVLPSPQDLFLIIEVSESSLDKDQTIKVPLYAQNDVPEVWIVNLKNKTLEVYREPSPNGYASVSTLDQSQTVSPLSFPDIQLPIRDIFPYKQ